MKFVKIMAVSAVFSLLIGQSAVAQIAALDYTTNPLYNPNHIISDAEMTDYNSMTLEEIKSFLQSKQGPLKSYEIIAPNGLNKSAAEIIWQSAQNNKISPKVLLVLLQKEQSLIDNPNPTQYNFDWATGYARCDSCGADDPNALKHKGFEKQVADAASFLRFSLDNQDQSWLKKAGLIYNVDSIPIIPTNQATANLYTYTPHFYGNYNFWKIWQRWFSQKYPDGLLVQIKGDDKIWLIQDGKLHGFKNKAVFLSLFNPKNIILINSTDLDSYTQGAEIKFINYSLVKIESKKIYLLVDDKKRLVDKQAFRYYGFDPEEVLPTKESELVYYQEWAPVTVKTKYPLGILMQDIKSKNFYFVVDGKKFLVLDKAMIKIDFPTRKLIKTTAAALKKYTEGDPILFNDGTWLKTKDSPEIYLISNSTRRLIQDQATFLAIGGDQENIIVTSEKVLGLHPLGDPISLTTANNNTSNLTQANQ